MTLKEVVSCAFIDAVDRVLFQDNGPKAGFSYHFFGGSLENGETPEEALIKRIIEELDFDLSNHKVRHFGDYRDPFSKERTSVEHVYITRFPGFSYIKDMEERNLVLMPISTARRHRLLPSYHRILEDLETALRSPNFSLP